MCIPVGKWLISIYYDPVCFGEYSQYTYPQFYMDFKCRKPFTSRGAYPPGPGTRARGSDVCLPRGQSLLSELWQGHWEEWRFLGSKGPYHTSGWEPTRDILSRQNRYLRFESANTGILLWILRGWIIIWGLCAPVIVVSYSQYGAPNDFDLTANVGTNAWGVGSGVDAMHEHLRNSTDRIHPCFWFCNVACGTLW